MDAFAACFGRPPAVVSDAPGRVNLIGEHTDYNGGLVLPLAIPQRTRAAVAPRDDGCVRAASANAEGIAEYRLGAEHPTGGWTDYVAGLTRVLRAAGHPIAGFDLYVRSDVPIGSGLSSSAALEVAILRALRKIFALQLDDVTLAGFGQRAETAFVGARVGIMDQMAASLANERCALLIQTRTLAYREVPLPAHMEIVVIDSGLRHHHASGDYNTRRAECEAAAARLDVALLCELETADLPRLAMLPPPLDRRARHVITENARVSEAVAALETNDLRGLRRLLATSHASLRDDYEVSVPEIDLLVDIAVGHPDVFGARLTGGGFGGSIVAVTPAGIGAAAGAEITRAYRARSGRTAAVVVPASGGAR